MREAKQKLELNQEGLGLSKRKEVYLQEKGVRSPFVNIIKQINSAYNSKMYVCVDLLTRKLLETVIIDILLKNPGPVAVWINPQKNHRQTLHYMLTRFWSFMKTSYKEFIPQYPNEFIKELQDISWDIKKIGDIQAHALVSSAVRQSIENRRDKLQSLIDFLLDFREKIPESITLVSIEESAVGDDLRINVRHPKAFPSVEEMGRAFLAPFDIIVTLRPPKETTNCRVYIKSESQAVIFELEPPIKRWKWRNWRPRKIELDVALDAAIETHLNQTSSTEFRFHGIFRKNKLRPLQKEIVFIYRVSALAIESKKGFDTGACRFTIPIGEEEQDGN